MASACIEPYTWHTPPETPDLSPDFEFFRLDDPTVTILPADELFSDGKLVPLKPISTVRSSASVDLTKPVSETPRPIRVSGLSDPDPYAFSPRAPTCSIKWKNILKLKKLSKTSNISTSTNTSSTSTNISTSIKQNPINNPSARSLIGILNRAGTAKIPALSVSVKDSDTDSVSTSSRLSLSSSSSSHDHDEGTHKPTKSRVAVAAAVAAGTGDRERVLADSPRLNSSGKVVFERSSSSPGSFTGGPRHKHSGGIERSYSAHVRVTPVLNVPVKFGFSVFGSHKRETGNGNVRVQRRNSRNGNRTEIA